jgi:hypothetical protein
MACLLAAVSLVRALLLQYVVPLDSMWSLLRIGLAFAAFAIIMIFAMSLANSHVSARDTTLALLIPVGLVAIARLEIGASYPVVFASASSAILGGIFGALIGEIAIGQRTVEPK